MTGKGSVRSDGGATGGLTASRSLKVPSLAPKMPAAFSMLSRRAVRRPEHAETAIGALEPRPLRSIHRRMSSRSCEGIGIAFSSPAEARMLQQENEVAMRDGDVDLEDVLNLYHEDGGHHSEPETGSIEDASSRPPSQDISSTTRTTPIDRSEGLCADPAQPNGVVSGVRTGAAAASPPAPGRPSVNSEALRDRYGFRCQNQHVDGETHRKWSASYEETLERRKKKWDQLLHEGSARNSDPVTLTFPARSTKMQRYIRKGIPPEYRGQVWFHYADGPRKLRDNKGLYEILKKRAEGLDDTNTELIERDLHRTFPDNINFKPEGYVKPAQTLTPQNIDSQQSREPTLIQSLRWVLRAFALHRPKVGYCQSLNFIAGLFLLFLDEERSFWMLVIVTTEYLPNVHDTNLEGANIDQAVLMLSIKENLPAIWSKMGGGIDGESDIGPPSVNDIVTKLPPITLVTAAWFMSAFTGILPIETTLRVWDCFFYEGSKILFRVALTILRLGEARILAVHDFIEIFQVVQALPKDLIDPAVLMEACFKRRNAFGHLSQKDVDQRRVKVAKMRQKATNLRQSRDDLRVEMEGSRQPSSRSIFRR